MQAFQLRPGYRGARAIKLNDFRPDLASSKQQKSAARWEQRSLE